MIDFSNKLVTLQQAVKPKLIRTLEIFARKFNADFLQVVFQDQENIPAKTGDLFFGKEPIDPAIVESIREFSRTDITEVVPEIFEYQGALSPDWKGNPDFYSSFIIVPVYVAEGSLGIIILGFEDAITGVPRTYTQLGYELMYHLMDLLFQQALANEDIRHDFLLAFGKMLVDVQDCKQLFYLLDTILKPHIGYSDCTIFLFDTHGGAMNNLCFDSESKLPMFPFQKSIAAEAVLADDIIWNGLASKSERAVSVMEKYTQDQQINLFLKSEARTSPGKGKVFNLYSGREIIGNCIFLFDDKHQFNHEVSGIFPLIINYLTTAVIKIRAMQEITRHKEEREILQSLHTEIAFNKDKTALLRSLNPKLKLLFDYSHHFVVGVNDDQLTVVGLLLDTESRARFHPRYKQVTTSNLLISDQIFNKVFLSNDPIIFDLEAMAAHQTLPEYMTLNMECGIKKMAMVSLRVGSRIIGVWALSLLEHQNLNAYQLELFKGISHQLSIAAQNIKAGEIVSKKNREREFLSQMSSDITAIRGRKDLDKLFNLTLKNHFRFQSAEILIKNELGFSKFSYAPSVYGADPEQDEEVAEDCIDILNFVFADQAGTATAMVIDMEAIIKRKDIPDCIRLQYTSGINTKVCVKLGKDQTDIGVVFFNFTETHDLVEKNLDLFNSISFHLSTAICNVIANEEVVKREQERDLLLSLSTEIAAIKNAGQLIRMITEKLKVFLGFSYISIGTLNDSGETFEVLVFDPESICRRHDEYRDLTSTVFPVNDGVINKILMSPVPVSFDLQELDDKNQLTPYLRISKECGVVQLIGVRFSKELSPFGCLVLFFDKELQLNPGKSRLINGLANQISIAVANILANQELKRRSEEDSKLLLFGSELRSVRDIPVLLKILRVQLKELFQIREFMVSILSEDQKSHKALFYEENSIFAGHPDFSKLIKQYMPVADTAFGVTLDHEEPVIFDMELIAGNCKLHGDLNAVARGAGEGIIGAVMKLGKQPVGFMLFKHDHPYAIASQQQLFESICSQIAIVISNIFSHQKVEMQLKEIEAYKQQLEEEKIYLTEEIETIHNYTEIIGESTALKDTFRLVSQVSPSDSTVLILGETGTGKELIARAIHNNSPRKNKLMVKVNCAALPANLIESELFGHEKGSFTGATERRLGKFELANNGTLFLDEIGEMPIDLQVKLLRALQEKEIERVGGKETIKVDVRIIAATNRDLEKEIAEGRFRSDLYYRLNIFPISLPPLRDRKQDIESLAMHFIKQFNKNCGKNINSISSRALQELMTYNWPGNIRELEHLIERSVLLNSGTTLKELLLPSRSEQLVSRGPQEELTLKTIDENEKDYILKVLKHCGGRIAGQGGAAQILGVPPTTLNSKLKRLGIKREHTM